MGSGSFITVLSLFAGFVDVLVDVFVPVVLSCPRSRCNFRRLRLLSTVAPNSMVIPMRKQNTRYGSISFYLPNQSDTRDFWNTTLVLLDLPTNHGTLINPLLWKSYTAWLCYINNYYLVKNLSSPFPLSLNFVLSLLRCLFLKNSQVNLADPALWVGKKEKGKGKLSYANLVINDPTKNINVTNLSDYQTKKGNTNPPSSLLPNSSSDDRTKKPNVPNKIVKSPQVFDSQALFKKLAFAGNQAKKKKELTMVAFLVGEQKEFSKRFTKLRIDWRTSKGDISFSALKAGWFEINFANQSDYNRVWESRPYHVFSQLLLLKPWFSGFDPAKESISQLDLWVWLHFLPEEFANPEALSAIMEGNFAGSFIRMDPLHNSNRMNMFTRFCINTDVALNIGKKIIIPDDDCNLIKYKLWFDDFPDGCGACGLPDHEFEVCPNRAIPVPILRITIRKNSKNSTPGSASMASSSLNQDWTEIGRNNKPIPNSLPKSNNQNEPYFSGKSGVNITYESGDSDDVLNVNPELDLELDSQPHLVYVSDGINNVETEEQVTAANMSPEHHDNCNSDGANPMIDQTNHLEQTNPIFKDNEEFQVDLAEMFNQNYILNSTLPAEMDLPSFVMAELINNNSLPINEMINTENLVNENFEEFDPMLIDPLADGEEENYNITNEQGEDEYFEEEEDEPYEDGDDDDPLEEENEQESQHNTPSNPTGEMSLLRSPANQVEPDFTDQDVDLFINNSPIDDQENALASETSFHSIHNSINSSSSVVRKISDLEVNVTEKSNSTSSKRKNNEGMDDTASSDATGGKKPRF